MIGDICHIRAAEADGPRFDKSMTNETRRQEPNLLLMCTVHHRKIDREWKTYTVAKLAKMKADHEAHFSEIEGTLTRRFEEQLTDETDAIVVTEPTTFARFNAVIEAYLDDAERIEIARGQIADYSARLRLLPDADRKLVAAAIRRATKVGGRRVFGAPSITVHARKFGDVHGIGQTRVKRFCETLGRHGLGGLHETFGDHEVRLNDPSEYVHWMDVVAFAESADIDIDEFVIHLRFGLLD